jgi:hypothetical protein
MIYFGLLKKRDGSEKTMWPWKDEHNYEDRLWKQVLRLWGRGKWRSTRCRVFSAYYKHHCRSQWPRGLRRGSAEIVSSTPTRGTDVCLLLVLSVLSGRGLFDELITRPEESYRLWWVVVCDLEISWMRRPWPTRGCRAKIKHYWSNVKDREELQTNVNCTE